MMQDKGHSYYYKNKNWLSFSSM